MPHGGDARDKRDPADSQSTARPDSGRVVPGESTSEVLEEFAAVLKKMAAETPLGAAPPPKAVQPPGADSDVGLDSQDLPASPIRTYSYGVSDLDGRPVTYNLVSPPEGGRVLDNGDGTFDFDPGSDFQHLSAGEIRDIDFTYQASDEVGGTATANVKITVVGGGDGAPAVSVNTVESAAQVKAVSGIETMYIDGVTGAPGTGGWTIALNEGEIVETNLDHLVLSGDAAGVIILGKDTGEIFFEGINRIEW